MDKKRVVLLLLLLVVALGGIKYKESRDERERLDQAVRMKAAAKPPKPVRNWRYRDEPEWVAHQRRMAGVYSQAGLQTLGKAHERMGEFKEAASVYRLITERYGRIDEEDEFYIRHAQRHGAAPFESETADAMERIFPDGLRTISIEQAAQAKRPLSLNLRGVFGNNLRSLGLSHRDAFVAVDGYVVETPEQYYAVFSFTDDANVAFLVKREDGKVEEIKGMLYRAHYDVVGGGRKTKEKKTTL